MKILVVDDGVSPFGRRDAKLLSTFTRVKYLPYRGKMDLPKLAWETARADAVLSWFALGYAYSATRIAKALGKRSYIAAGGWDVEWMPEIGYGALNPKRRKMTRWALENCTKVLCVSEWNERSVKRIAPRSSTVVAHLSVDTSAFGFIGNERKNAVCTLAGARNVTTVKVKGLDVFVEVAGKMPGWEFHIGGGTDRKVLEEVCGDLPENLTLHGHLRPEELHSLYGRCAVYAQLSYQESFGLAPAEAAACGCRVVVSDRGALPEIHGDYAEVVRYGDVDGIVRAISRSSLSPRRLTLPYTPETRRDILGRIIR